MPVQTITPSDLEALSRVAADTPRRRQHLNLHSDYADPCQRLFNAVEPGSYIRPHRHADPPKPEFFLAVCGRFVLLLFDDAGTVTRAVHLAPDGPYVAVDVPAGTWHTIVALEPGSVFFEAKPGPYVALSDKDFPSWAPAEQSAQSLLYLEMLYEAVLDAEP
jgi:cupin fold WbuC family metalloprotein